MTDAGEKLKLVREGKACCELPDNVFYNPVQEFNRDVSIQLLRCISAYREPSQGPLRVLEALAASGLRSARYALELPSDKFELHANDRDVNAFEALKRNLKELKVETHCEDACQLMRKNLQFDVIDLDPYGSPAKLLESAVVGIRRPGVLLVTATDTAVLCGSGQPQRHCCLGRYGSLPMPNNPSCHEFGLRILIYSILQRAALFGASVEPLLSLSVDFYFRLFVRVKRGHSEVKSQLAKNCGYCLYCPECLSQWLKGMTEAVDDVAGCPFCQSRLRMAGPIWMGPLHSPTLVKDMLAELEKPTCDLPTSKRMIGLLSVVLEELESPLYISLSDLCKKMNTTMPSMKDFRSALANAGYEVSSTHCNRNGIKTNAPYNVVWTLLNHWAEKNPPKKEKTFSQLAQALRAYKDDTVKVDFSFRSDAQSQARSLGLKRFPPNPEPFWGPAKRPRIKVDEQDSNHNE